MQNPLRFISSVYLVLVSVGLIAHVEIIPGIVKRNAWNSVLLTVLDVPLYVFLLHIINAIIHTNSYIKIVKQYSSTIQYYYFLLPLGLYMLLVLLQRKEFVFWSQLTYLKDYNIFLLRGTCFFYVCCAAI